MMRSASSGWIATGSVTATWPSTAPPCTFRLGAVRSKVVSGVPDEQAAPRRTSAAASARRADRPLAAGAGVRFDRGTGADMGAGLAPGAVFGDRGLRAEQELLRVALDAAA